MEIKDINIVEFGRTVRDAQANFRFDDSRARYLDQTWLAMIVDYDARFQLSFGPQLRKTLTADVILMHKAAAVVYWSTPRDDTAIGAGNQLRAVSTVLCGRDVSTENEAIKLVGDLVQQTKDGERLVVAFKEVETIKIRPLSAVVFSDATLESDVFFRMALVSFCKSFLEFCVEGKRGTWTDVVVNPPAS